MKTNTRALALAVLTETLHKGAFPKSVIESLSGGLAKRDRAFLRELSYGALRQKDLLDWLMNGFLRKKPGGDTMDILRLALYQIFFMRVPERAAVFESVELERNRKNGKPEFVNAVLRNVLRNKESLKKKMDELENKAEKDEREWERLKAISTFTSHPLWLVKRYAKRTGADGALSLARANNKIPPLTLRINRLKADRNKVIAMLGELSLKAEPGKWSPDALKLSGRTGFGELGDIQGLCAPQDEAAQLISYVVDPRPGERVLDGCAAPGGKTTHMAELMGDSGEILAMDIDEERMAKLEENTHRLGLKSVKTFLGDLSQCTPEMIGTFDRVLVDAPCSSLGVIRRNPDVKYTHSEKDLRRYSSLQEFLLRRASLFVKKDGILVFSTCSTEPEEGEDVITEFMNSEEGEYFRLEKPPVSFPGPLLLANGFFLRTWPDRDDMDGFFCARLKKI